MGTVVKNMLPIKEMKGTGFDPWVRDLKQSQEISKSQTRTEHAYALTHMPSV